MSKGTVKQNIVILTLSLFVPCLCEAADTDIEKDLQRNLQQSKTVIGIISDKLRNGIPMSDELDQLKVISENIKTSNLLLQERFTH